MITPITNYDHQAVMECRLCDRKVTLIEAQTYREPWYELDYVGNICPFCVEKLYDGYVKKD